MDRCGRPAGDLAQAPRGAPGGGGQQELFAERFHDGRQGADQGGLAGSRAAGDDGDALGENGGQHLCLLV